MKKIIASIFLMAAVLPFVHAQSLTSTVEYFQPGFSFRHTFNPAFVPQWGYVTVGAGNINVNVSTNMGLGNFLFPLENGKVGTFLHPDVSADRFISSLHNTNRLGVDFSASLLSAGWFWGKGFWSVDVSVKTDMQVNVPKEFLAFIKKGMYDNPSSYHIEDLGMDARAYIEASVGYAREISPEWTVGGKFKFLTGVTQVGLHVGNMDINLSDEAWKVTTDAEMNVYGAMLEMDGMMPSGIGTIGPSGYGMAVDLGAEYRPDFAPGLRFSLSILNLGFLNYTQSSVRHYKADGSVNFTGFDNLSADADLESTVGQLTDDVKDLFDFKQQPADGASARMLSPTLNVGVEYGLWDNRFSVGLLSTTVFHHLYVETDLSLVGTIHPCRWFSASLAYSFIGNRRGLGWALNFTPKWGLNFFFASSYTPLCTNSMMIPVKGSQANFQFGITVPIGNNRRCTFASSEYDANYFPYTIRDSESERYRNRYERMIYPDRSAVRGSDSGQSEEEGEDDDDEQKDDEQSE